MAQDPDREFDKTSLKRTVHGQGVHRDYAAHFFRWGFVSHKLVRADETRILDIGCGVDTPLPHVLHLQRMLVPRSYLGVDLNRLTKTYNYKWAEYCGEFNFADRWKELRPRTFDLITCLEVVEHMRPDSCVKVFRGALSLVAPGGRFVVSTPVFNGKAAKNHIHEMDIPTLQNLFTETGWRVIKRFGTFASYNDIKKVATSEQIELVDRLREYYSYEVLACFLAPLYPDHARNNIWICEPEEYDFL